MLENSSSSISSTELPEDHNDSHTKHNAKGVHGHIGESCAATKDK